MWTSFVLELHGEWSKFAKESPHQRNNVKTRASSPRPFLSAVPVGQ
jgi:hypothetical protein